jgi:hypothetical protein
MAETVTLSLGNVQEQNAAGAIEQIAKIPDVEEARLLQRRSIDVESAMAIIKVAGSVLGLASTAWTLILQIRRSLEQKQISGARLTLPNGARLELDSVTEDQLVKIMESSSKPAGGA